jgi:uncharacterized protein (DUF934 family)
MPLIRDGRFTSDDWLRPEQGASLPWYGKLLLSRERLSADGASLAEAGHLIGVEVPNDTAPADLEAWLPTLHLIAIAFPKSADGRGFTLAQRLRRLGFRGELRAVGHVIPDQYALALSCGFDTVEISEALAARQPEAHWREAGKAMSWAYQSGGLLQRSILSARWAATAAE